MLNLLNVSTSSGAIAICAKMLITVPAFAQTSVDTSSTESDIGIPDIIVTAQRREESLQKTPVAVTALGEQQLVDRGVRSVLDLQQSTPNLQIATQTAGSGTSSATFFIRGLGQQRSGNGTQPAVGIYVDDFYYPSLSGNLFKVLDVERIEVLRGPQGTLFGRNTIGGAVRYVTRKPTDEISGFLDLTAGSRNHFDGTGVFNSGITDKLFARVTIASLNQGGFSRRATDGGNNGKSNSEVARLQLRYLPTDTLTIDLTGGYIRDELHGVPVYIPAVSTTAPFAAAYNLTHSTSLYDNRYISSCFYCSSGTDKPEYIRTRYTALQASIAWDINPDLTLKSLTGQNDVSIFADYDSDYSPLPIRSSTNRDKTEAFSQEFQLNGQAFGGRVNFVSGLYYFSAKDFGNNVISGVANSVTVSTRSTKSYAAYAQATLSVTDALSATAGIRFSRETIDYASTSAAGTGSNNRTFKDTSPVFKLQYQWSPGAMTYVSVSHAFRGGGFNTSLNTSLPNGGITAFEPESVWSYEGGARLDLFDRRLRVNPTVFYVDYSTIQLQAIFPVGPGAFSLLVQNAAKGRVWGTETEVVASITRDLELHGNVSTINSKYTELGNALQITLQSKFMRSPKVSYSIGGRYMLHLVDGSSVNFNIDWSWQDDQQTTPTSLDTQTIPSYGLLNGRIQYNFGGDRLHLAAYARNALNNKYFIGGTDYRRFTGPNYFDVGQPRELGANLRFDF